MDSAKTDACLVTLERGGATRRSEQEASSQQDADDYEDCDDDDFYKAHDRLTSVQNS